jgi:hypothetical protein
MVALMAAKLPEWEHRFGCSARAVIGPKVSSGKRLKKSEAKRSRGAPLATTSLRESLQSQEAKMKQFTFTVLSAIMVSGFLTPIAAQETGVPQSTSQYEKLEAASTARVVPYSKLLYLTKGTEERALSLAQEGDLADLRLRVSKSQAAQAALLAAGLTEQDVVAVASGQNGVLLLYVDDL